MKQQINQEVSIISLYDAKNKNFAPQRLRWQNRDYILGKVDYYHSYMEGRERQHIYELCDDQQTLWFRLRQNGLNNHWILEAVHDGLAD